MQRKRARGYYSDTIELGTNIIPIAKMRKFTLSNLLKYFIVIIIVYIVYSVYQKISQVSKSSVSSDLYWEDDIRIDKKNLEPGEELDRRVKHEINKVFEELKQKHDKNAKEEDERDVFKEYFEENDDDDDNLDANEKLSERNGGKNNDGDFIVDKKQDDPNKPEEEYPVSEDGKEKTEADKELMLEKEIEERLAEAFKDAVNEAADELVDEGKIDNIDDTLKELGDKPEEKIGDTKNVKDEVEVPEVKQVFEKKEFKLAVEHMGKRLNPLQMKKLSDKARKDALKHDDDHEFPPFVTAVRQTTLKQVTQLVASVQLYFPGQKIYIYDLDLDNEQKKQLMSYCGVKLRHFMITLFPTYVSDLDKLHWKPLVMQTALAEFGHMVWVNPQYKLGTSDLGPIVHESHDQGILVLGQSAAYTTFSATHPDMLKFLPSDKEKLSSEPHVEIRAVIVHNTPEVHENIMKVFTACALEESCLAPPGAKWQCKFDFTGRKPAGCHRFDESALNILIKNWFKFDATRYVKRSNNFRPYDSTHRPSLKLCREAKDIRDTEL